jgi:hypothetical protein
MRRIYNGPIRSAVRNVKLFSMSSLVMTTVSGPFLYLGGNPDVSSLSRAALAFTGLDIYSSSFFFF